MVDTEKMATSLIEQRIATCAHVVSYIDSNDKTPLTDGFVILYSGLGRSNADIEDRLDVQVKGRTVAARTAPTTYTMSRGDIAAIRRHGTVLLFVVFLKPDGSYFGPPKYATLAPYSIDLWVGETPRSRKSIAVPLRDLPDDSAAIEGIARLAVLTKKQRMFEGVSTSVLEDGASITIHAREQFTLDAPMVFSPARGDFVVEVTTPAGIVVPLAGVLELRPGTYKERPAPVTARTGDIEFDTATIRQIDANSHELKLSQGVSMRLVFEGQRLIEASVNLNLVDNLAERVRDIDFFLSAAQSGVIELNGGEFSFNLSDMPDVTGLRATRKNLSRLVELLEMLHADARLVSMSEIDEEQSDRLQYAYASLVQNKPIKSDDAEIAHVFEQLGRWRLQLFVLPFSLEHLEQAGEHTGKTGKKKPREKFNSWKFVDPYAPENRRQFRLFGVDDVGKTSPVRGTVYDAMQREELPHVLNLHLDTIVDAYKTIAELPETSGLANQCVLKLIHAADDEPLRKTEFLDAAQRLNDWLIEEEPESMPNVLNRFQIRARRPEGLADAERDEIRALRRQIVAGGGVSAPVHEMGCAILLGGAEDIRECSRRLTESELESLKGYPIWSLVPAQEVTADA